MTKTIRTLLSLFTLVGFLAACSSNPTTEPEPSPEPAPVVAETPDPVDTTPADPYDSVNVDTVFYFEFDQSILTAEARAALTVHAQILANTSMSIRLEGHADERGSREYNMALGERRANAVRDFLVLQGVSSSQIETVSYGEEQPAEVGSYDASWAKNRRVELVK